MSMLCSPEIVVALRICFVRLPDVETERIFRDSMVITDPDAHTLDDLNAVVDKKIAFMEYPPCDYTILIEDETGDRIVVDHVYYSELLRKWLKGSPLLEHTRQLSAGDPCTTSISVSLSVEVEVNKIKSYSQSCFDGAERIAPLTVENLAKIRDSCQDPGLCGIPTQNELKSCLVSIKNLSCPAKPNFVVRGVIIAIRMKVAKSGIEVVEVDLCDADDTKQQITAVSFDATVRKAIKDNLRGDRRKVVELHQVYVRKKNETDICFQSNAHPLILRLDRHSRIEVVQVLAIPLKLSSFGSVVTVRQNMPSCGVLDVGVLVSSMGVPKSSSHISSGTNDGSPQLTAAGQVLPRVQSRSTTGTFPGRSSGGVHCKTGCKRSTQEREDESHQYIHIEESRKDRIRQRKEISNQCILCGLDCDNVELSMPVVRRLLEDNSRNRGTWIPTPDELRRALSDNRKKRSHTSSLRLLSNASFVNLNTKTVHRVHCRCAHLCSDYQQGKSIEDIVVLDLACSICTLCGLSGATVCCYHPDCNERYHCICALFSKGYVNFGKKDPYMPCPACPRHTQVVVTSNRDPVLHEDASCWEDNIAFDSRVVESTDLRDPDENGGI